jgi:zinc protease
MKAKEKRLFERPMETMKRENVKKKACQAGDAFRRLIALPAMLTLAIAASAFTAAPALARPLADHGSVQPSAIAPAPQQSASAADIVAKQAALVTEFDVNGLKVLVKRRVGSQTVSAGLFLRGGSRNITAGNAGIEALMLTVVSEASSSFPREKLRRELAKMGTVIGDGVNKDYSALTLGTTRANFDHSWEIFTDVALHPSFTKEDVELARSRMITSLRDDTDTPDSYLQRLQDRVAYTGHPYLNRPEGTAESLAHLTIEDLQAYHRQMMQTSRLLLVVIGDLNPSQIRDRIATSFGKLPHGDYKPQPVPQLSFSEPSVEVTQRGLPTNYIQGIFSAPALTSEDIYAMRVASSILQDRVFEEVRVKRNLSYSPEAFLRSQGANVGGIYVTATDPNQTIRVMLGEISKLQRDAIEPQDISAVVAQYLTNYYLGEETNAAQAGELAMYELIGGGWRNSQMQIERLRAVKPVDVQRVARTYMRNIRFVVLGDPSRVDKSVFTNQVSE